MAISSPTVTIFIGNHLRNKAYNHPAWVHSIRSAATSVTDEGNGTRGVQKISQVDGAGRLLSVCEVSAAALTVGADHTPAVCGQDIAATGFLTTYTYNGLKSL